MKLLRKRSQKSCGSYTTTSWSESNSSSGGPVNKSNSMNLIQRPLLTTDEILRIERPYLLVMCSGLSPAMTYSPDLSKWKFNEILGLGMTKCRFYDLRGSYATKILRNGVEIKDVADILGHSNIETTENYYISSSNESRKTANDIFEKITYSDTIREISNYKINTQ